jgi:YVTN family beta-propeller protein
MKVILYLFVNLILTILLLSPNVYADSNPGFCKTGCFPFSLSGKIEGINPSSQLYQYNGYNYLISGVFNGAGALNIDHLKVASGDPRTCGGGCVADEDPIGCDSGCLTAVSSGGKFIVTLSPQLTGTIGSVTNISTQPAINMVFPDASGTMTLANLSSILPQLESVQFPTMGLSKTGISETWTPTVLSAQLGQVAEVDPNRCSYGCKYSFSLNGKIQGVPLNSPLASYNNYYYTATGDFSSNGAVNSAQLKMDVLPGSCGGGCINADIDPGSCGSGGCVTDGWPPGCDTGCNFDVTIKPIMLFSHGSLNNVNTTPTITFSFDNPTGSLDLNSLQNSVSSLKSVAFPSLALSGSGMSESWTPTVATYSLTASPVDTYAYIPNYNANNVSVIKTTDNTLVTTIPVGTNPWGVAVQQGGSRVYITNLHSNNVSVIDTTTNTVSATIPVDAAPRGVTVRQQDGRVYVANYTGNTVSVINPITNAVIATIPVALGPDGVAVNPTGTRVYVASRGYDPNLTCGAATDRVSVIDTSSNTVIATINVGMSPSAVVVDPTGTKLYVTNICGSNTLSVIDTSTNTITATVPMAPNPVYSAITINPPGSRVYVLNTGGTDYGVNVIDTTTNTVIAKTPVTAWPDGIDITPNGAYLYVANQLSNTVSVIDTTTNAITSTITTATGGFAKPAGFGKFIYGPIGGVCGASNGGSFLLTPKTGLCASGTASAVTGSGPWNWTCNSTACTANKTAIVPIIPIVIITPPAITNITSSKSGSTFTILRSEAGSTFTPVVSNTVATSFTDNSTLKPNTVYQYAVTSDTDPTQTVLLNIRTPLYNGWNVIGVPYNTTGIATSNFFASPVSSIYLWIPSGANLESDTTQKGSYSTVSTLTPGYGYFVKASNSSTMLVYSGTSGTTASVTLKPGWTMIANPSTSNMTSIGTNWKIDGQPLSTAVTAGTVGGSLYWWNGTTYDFWSISSNPQIEPWKGYWIVNQTSSNHTLTIQ